MLARIASPFEAPFDVVIPWVNFADPGYCRAFNRSQPPSPRGFEELRFLLRSLEVHGWLDHVRNVVVLHSDFHAPPPFLRAHPRLRCISHSNFAPSSFLPLRSLEAITAHLHRIEGLTPWFLFAEDDGLVLSPIEVFRDFIWRHQRLAVYATSTPLADVDDASASTWERGAFEAARVLQAAFGPRERRLDLHTPHLLHLPTLSALAERWPQPPGHDRPVFNRVVLHDEFLVDTGQARRYPYDATCVDQRRFTDELHTNGHGFLTPVTWRTALRLCVRLHRAQRGALFLNVQGPGISAEYDDDGAHAYGTVFDAWLAQAFERPSMFEVGGR